MKVPQERMEKVLALYKPECRYLKSADLDLLKATGEFEISETFYTAEPLEHLAEAEAKMCLCQLAYVAFAEWIDAGEFESINLEFDEYLELMKENMYIIESRIKFKNQIDTSKPFKLEMQFRQEKPFSNTRIARFDYSFADGKAKGEIWFALVLSTESQ
jgi:hypothetical protein